MAGVSQSEPEVRKGERRMTEEETTSSAADASAPSDTITVDGAANAEQTAAPLADSEVATLRSRISELEQQLAEMEQKLAGERQHATEYMNHWQRTQADFTNFKRRVQQEQEQRDALATTQVVALFLPALDSFERAFATLPPTLLGYSWIDGISLVQMHRALQVHGVQQMEIAPGQPFDPLRHESIGEVESEEHPEGHIAVVVQSGYEVQGRVLRPALVQLARKKAAAPAAQETEQAEQTGQAAAATGNASDSDSDNDSQDNNRANEAEGTV